MNVNLINRIFTSIILFIILYLALVLNQFFLICLLFITAIISLKEFNNLTKKIFKKEIKKIYLTNMICFIYLTFFVLLSYNLFISDLLNFIFVLLICIFSDTGGYIVGKFLGGKKLTKLSPKKTISGSIGSFIFSLIPIIIFWFFYNNYYESRDISLLVFTCLFLSLICQAGDLFISFFKRQAKVKDTGSLLPGHGGLLDRIDGIIFVLPIAFIFEKLF